MGMDCLHCGDCCERMSPLTADDVPCPRIVSVPDLTRGDKAPLVFCGCYEQRPQQCRDHAFPASKCPIGLDVLAILSPSEAHLRIDEGYRILTETDTGFVLVDANGRVKP